MKNLAQRLALAGLALALVVPAGLVAADLEGSYKLVKRVLPDGTEIGWGGDLMGFMSMDAGWRNFNVTWTEDGRRASLSLIANYRLSDGEYCEDVHYWLQNNLGTDGMSYTPPAAKQDCSAVTMADGAATFDLPGEPVVVTFDDDGFVATSEGVFIDYWEKLE